MTAAAPSRIAASKVCVLQVLVLEMAARALSVCLFFADFSRLKCVLMLNPHTVVMTIQYSFHVERRASASGNGIKIVLRIAARGRLCCRILAMDAILCMLFVR